jgi:hypothetical protein
LRGNRANGVHREVEGGVYGEVRRRPLADCHYAEGLGELLTDQAVEDRRSREVRNVLVALVVSAKELYVLVYEGVEAAGGVQGRIARR